MKRIILMMLRNWWFLPYGFIKLYYTAWNADKLSDEQRYKTLKMIVRRANKAGNIKIQSFGINHIPKDGGFVFFPNHQGMYDVLALIECCERPFSVVNKKELENIPVLSKVFRCMKAISLDRSDVRQGIKVIQQVATEVKQGRPYVIFPEGTRSKLGNKLLEFKGGSFKSAMKAQCPIIPVALIDSYKAFDTSSIKQITVQVHFLEPIPYEEYKEMKSVEIAEMVKSRIEERIKECE